MKKLLRILQMLFIAGAFLGSAMSHACMWDSDTMWEEKWNNPKFAKAILSKGPEKVKPTPLRERIKKLTTAPRENDPAWWNDLAGAHLRLGEAKQAAELLEKIVERFPSDYGIHANLGTAYHLLGRYQEAEKEIARDLEINPDAHFGLEKYHLALLQYLVRDAKYRSRHLYVDEFTAGFLQNNHALFHFTDSYEGIAQRLAEDYTNGVAKAEADYELLSKSNRYETYRGELLATIATLDSPPSYRTNWNLAQDLKLKEGVIYMASVNPKEPACFVMLGMVTWKDRDLNLAAAAFEKAIALGSPQSEMLLPKINSIREHIKKARSHAFPFGFSLWATLSIIVLVVAFFWSRTRAAHRKSRAAVFPA